MLGKETVVTNETDDTVVQLFSSVSFQIAFIITLFAGWMKAGWKDQKLLWRTRRRLREWSSWFDHGGKDPTWYFRWISGVVESEFSILTISYDQRISPLCSNHCWVAYNLNNCEERLLIQTLPRFFLPNLDHHNVCLLTSRDSVEKVSQVQSLLENQGLAPALEATFANGLVIIMRIVIAIVFIIIIIIGCS